MINNDVSCRSEIHECLLNTSDPQSIPTDIVSIESIIKDYTDSIKALISSCNDERAKYELKRLVEIELSEVLGLYTHHYRNPTPLQIGYMPSQ